MCNLYSHTRAQEAMRQLFSPLVDLAGNLEPGLIYPDQKAPILRHGPDGGLELVKARWGMPTPAFALKTARDPGVTNLRNLASSYWRPWLTVAHRCLVPVTAFAEPKAGGGTQWFAPANREPAFFAGVELRGWKSVRKVKDGETTDDLFAFLTCEPSREVAAIHPKAMPVLLTRPQDWQRWMTAPLPEALTMQRPLPDDSLDLIEAPI